ncbi:hypothetical protein H8891_03040 [Paeniclostridium sp. NSJ-45]|uniref:Uncharacterized protein n=1 Tax=Paeniclostridium hominis TaxID=2764329 RepID=A0ABR7K1L2_9FIRM|nr:MULTISPECIES: hypothetical protein [Paeniclostridium]MBC6002764.1 hypothetical protein [Paeniclostridium hominis]
MPKKTNYYNNCNTFANQYMILVAIFASIISQEIDEDENLGILGSFLVALGEELALASEIRISCKAKLEEENNTESKILDTFDRSYIKKRKKIKRKVLKK